MLVRRYKVFTPRLYLSLVLFIIPVAAFGVQVLFERLGLLSTIAAYWLFLIADIFGDYWVFGGICSKSSARLEYMKSSFYGSKVMRTGIVMDLVRRLLWMLLLCGACMGYFCIRQMGHLTVEDWLFIGVMTLSGYGVNTLALNGTRYLETFQMYSLWASFITGFTTGFVTRLAILEFSGDKTTNFWWTLLIGLAVFDTVVSVVTVCHMMFRVRRTYVDAD